jgi:hypothetical protein
MASGLLLARTEPSNNEGSIKETGHGGKQRRAGPLVAVSDFQQWWGRAASGEVNNAEVEAGRTSGGSGLSRVCDCWAAKPYRALAGELKAYRPTTLKVYYA